MNFQRIVNILSPITKNKYLLTLFIFLIWLTFFDRDNLVDRIRNMNKLEKLEAKKEMYKLQIEQDKENLVKLQDVEYLEQFAREEHLMKKDNEDLFVILPED